jgi:hypothetical protein
LFSDDLFVVVEIHQKIVQEMDPETLYARAMKTFRILLMIFSLLKAGAKNVCLTTKVDVMIFAEWRFVWIGCRVKSIAQFKPP